MNVIWAWNNSDSHGIDFVSGHKLRIALTLASVLSWKKYYPEDTRILYCCPDTKKQLEKKGWVEFWDKVEEIDFDSRFREMGVFDTPCWGLPKVYVMTLQREPFIVLDTDIYLLGDFKRGLSLDKVWVTASYNMKNLTGKEDVCFNLDSRIGKLSFIPKQGWTGESYNTGLMYFPDPNLGNLTASRSISLYRDLLACGSFEGKKRTDSEVPWEYVMGADEEVLFHTLKEEGIGVEILSDPVRGECKVYHEFDKWNLKKDLYEKKVQTCLQIAGLPLDLLDEIKNIQGILES